MNGTKSRQLVRLCKLVIGDETMKLTVSCRLIDFTKMSTHRITLDEFDTGLPAMRSGEALEVVIYPHGRENTVY